MFTNYLKVALRNILRHKGYSFINIFGLAVGMACCITIYLYVSYELSYDNYHVDGDRIFRVALDGQSETEHRVAAITSAPVGVALKNDYPQVEYVAQILPLGSGLVSYGETVFYEDNRILANSDLFNVLTIPFIQGDPTVALDRPNTVVISQQIADKCFPDEDPVGKSIKINSPEYEITGVVANAPDNTHLKYDLIMSMETIRDRYPFEEWFLCNFYTYIKIAPNVNLTTFSEQMSHLSEKYVKEELNTAGESEAYFLQPVKDIHLRSNLINEAEPPGSMLYIYIISTIGILILLIACANFMNLTTARSADRAKEVGLRKVMGAGRYRLAGQFLCESIIMSSLALFLALVMVELAAPSILNLAGIGYSSTNLIQSGLVFSMIGLVIFVGLFAGSYPAFILSAFQPVTILTGKMRMGSRGVVFRKILVLSQFTASIILIIGTITVYQQIVYMKNHDLGFDKEQKLIVPIRYDIRDNYNQVKDEFLTHPSITGASTSSEIPGQRTSCWDTRQEGAGDDDFFALNYLYIDQDFIPDYNIELVAGRNFLQDMSTDADGPVILNECAVRTLGWISTQEAIGKKIDDGQDSQSEIIGVTKDFHYRGLQAVIEPLVLKVRPGAFKNLTLTLNTNNLKESMTFIEGKWDDLFPGKPLEYFFLDENFNRQYRVEEQVSILVRILTSLGLFVSCLGLLGLASYASQCRTKEIGIRKILGATVSNIVGLLSQEFVILMAIANLIAFPVAYFVMSRWLQNFAYHTTLRIDTFLMSGLVVMAVALVAVSVQTIKAATANPVDALRYE